MFESSQSITNDIIVALMIGIFFGIIIGYYLCKNKYGFRTIKNDNNLSYLIDIQKSKSKINPIFNKNSSLDFKPMILNSSTKKDNLKRIKSINAEIEKNLYSIGIFQYDQIACWSTKNADWIENFLRLENYIKQNQWIEQAKILRNGNETEYSKQIDSGEIE